MIDYLQQEVLHPIDFSAEPRWADRRAAALDLNVASRLHRLYAHAEAFGPTPFTFPWDIEGWIELFHQKNVVARLACGFSANDGTAPTVPIPGPDNQTGTHALRVVFCNATESLSKTAILRPQFVTVLADFVQLNLRWRTPVFAAGNFTGIRAYLADLATQ